MSKLYLEKPKRSSKITRDWSRTYKVCRYPGCTVRGFLGQRRLCYTHRKMTIDRQWRKWVKKNPELRRKVALESYHRLKAKPGPRRRHRPTTERLRLEERARKRAALKAVGLKRPLQLER